MSQNGIFPKKSKNGTPYGNWNELPSRLTDQLKQEEGFTYDDGVYKHKVTHSDQFGWTVWGNTSDKKKQEAKQEQKKLDQDEKTKQIQEMADRRDAKITDLITAITTLGTKIDALTAAMEQKNYEEST